jgi:putative protease
MSKKSELLLPVGSEEMLLAAIHGGADAVYIGAPSFNARGRSTDFSIEELDSMIKLAHLYGVKVFLALNVVIFEDELDELVELIYRLIDISPDAFIVQDIGVAKIIRSISEEVVIHGSTQMTMTNADAINLLEDLNIKRFVLGRENSLEEIQLIRNLTDKELEVFIHGALCVSYSGQCFTSESLGGRSANRGQCAQSCRFEYQMIVDGIASKSIDKEYLVSPKDLCGINEATKLQAIGVDSLKVEGRLKGPGYVMSTAQNYQSVLNGDQINFDQRIKELSIEYSRGFFSGWLNGVDHQQLVEGSYSAHRGLEVGTVLKVQDGKLHIHSTQNLKAGDGLLIVKGKESIGAKIFKVQMINSVYHVELMNQKFRDDQFKSARVFLNGDANQEKELKKRWTMRENKKRIPITINIAEINHQIELIVSDGLNEIRLNHSKNPEKIISREKTETELLSLSHTPFYAKNIATTLSAISLDFKDLKKIKAEMIQKLSDVRTRSFEHKINKVSLKKNSNKENPTEVKLNVLLRSSEQVEGMSMLASFPYNKMIGSVILDFEFGKDYAQSVCKLKELGFTTCIATTRILKPKEYYNFKIIERANPDEVLVRNLGALNYFKNKNFRILGDFSLNVTNSVSFNYLIDKGLERINLSYDMNRFQVMNLIKNLEMPHKAEVTIHQFMPEFHMEHCVFAAFLSNGSSYKDCGKPCEKHNVELKDPYGNFHVLKADHECRNTLYRASAQSSMMLKDELQGLGIQFLRFEALNETATELEAKLLIYLKTIVGEMSLTDMQLKLQVQEKYGVNSGQILKTDQYKNIKQENPSLQT